MYYTSEKMHKMNDGASFYVSAHKGRKYILVHFGPVTLSSNALVCCSCFHNVCTQHCVKIPTLFICLKHFIGRKQLKRLHDFFCNLKSALCTVVTSQGLFVTVRLPGNQQRCSTEMPDGQINCCLLSSRYTS